MFLSVSPECNRRVARARSKESKSAWSGKGSVIRVRFAAANQPSDEPADHGGACRDIQQR